MRTFLKFKNTLKYKKSYQTMTAPPQEPVKRRNVFQDKAAFKLVS